MLNHFPWQGAEEIFPERSWYLHHALLSGIAFPGVKSQRWRYTALWSLGLLRRHRVKHTAFLLLPTAHCYCCSLLHLHSKCFPNRLFIGNFSACCCFFCCSLFGEGFLVLFVWFVFFLTITGDCLHLARQFFGNAISFLQIHFSEV